MMRNLILLCSLFFSLQLAAKEIRPVVWGKIINAKQETYGYKYFVYFRQDGKDYAYPLSKKSQIDSAKLQKLDGKYARIEGVTDFETIQLEGARHIMTFIVGDAAELTLADLNTNLDAYKDRMDVDLFKKKRVQTEQAEIKGLSDKAINAAIWVGGAVLAAEVLGKLLSQ